MRVLSRSKKFTTNIIGAIVVVAIAIATIVVLKIL
jgi:hypothetical protein